MRKLIVLCVGLLTLLFAGEGLPVLTFPKLAHEGYFPGAPPKKENGIHFSYANWYYDTDYSSIIAVYDSYRFGFQGLVSGNIDIRGDVPSTDPVGTTAYYNTALHAGRDWYLNDQWSLQTTLKLINERLYYAGSWGLAADVDLVYKISPGLRALAGFENLGRMSALLNEHTKTPARYYLGGDMIFSSFLLSFKGGFSGDMAAFFRIGAAYCHPIFDVRYSYDYLQRIHHLGAVLKWNEFRIGYGQFFHQNGLGNPMMFTVGMQF
jgi:hypothetical protein